MSINRLPEITFVFIDCLVDFVWKYRFGGERFPTYEPDEDGVFDIGISGMEHGDGGDIHPSLE